MSDNIKFVRKEKVLRFYAQKGRNPTEEELKVFEFVPEPQEPKTVLEVQMEADIKKEAEQAQLEAQGRHEKEEAEGKERLADQEQKRNIERYNAEFIGELPEHKPIRLAISKAHTVEERKQLIQQYTDLHYQVPRTLTFRKIVTYECEGEGVRLVKSGDKWTVRGITEHSFDHLKETPKVTIDPITKLPSLYTFLIVNEGLYKVLRRGQYCDLHIKLED